MHDRSAAPLQMLEAGLGRDFDINLKFVANIRMQAEQHTWRLAENEQESALRWATQHRNDLLYVHEQKTIEGTPDHQHQQHVAAAKAAAARQAALYRRIHWRRHATTTARSLQHRGMLMGSSRVQQEEQLMAWQSSLAVMHSDLPSMAPTMIWMSRSTST